MYKLYDFGQVGTWINASTSSYLQNNKHENTILNKNSDKLCNRFCFNILCFKCWIFHCCVLFIATIGHFVSVWRYWWMGLYRAYSYSLVCHSFACNIGLELMYQTLRWCDYFSCMIIIKATACHRLRQNSMILIHYDSWPFRLYEEAR